MLRDFALLNRARVLPLLGSSGRALRIARAALLALALASACTKNEDTEAYVPSQPGAVQPAAGGALISESSACSGLAAAEASARAALGCDANTLECPTSIRPAGGEGCFVYSLTSVESCKTLYQSFTSCDDFARHPCLISAVSNCDGAGSGEGGASGAAGAAGAANDAGAPGDDAAAGSAGSAGAAGEGGTGGTGG